MLKAVFAGLAVVAVMIGLALPAGRSETKELKPQIATVEIGHS